MENKVRQEYEAVSAIPNGKIYDLVMWVFVSNLGYFWT
jgi:hypothetical protein